MLLVPVTVYSQPSITGVTPSSFANGDSITISGSNFGSTGPTIVVFDDFEKGTNGNPISTLAGSATVNEWDAILYTTYSTAQAHSGTKSVRFNFGDAYNYGGDRQLSVNTTGSTRIYMSFWMLVPTGSYIPGVNTADGGNWKFALITGQPWPKSDYVVVLLGDVGGDYQAPNPWYDSSGLSITGYGTNTLAKNRWHRWEWYAVGSSASSGAMQTWETNSGNARHYIGGGTGLTTLHSDDTWDWVDFPAYARVDGTAINYYDDVYVATGDAAQARVEIGNNATYSNCTNLAIITPTSWSNTSITATVRTGSFSNGTAYLFVVDSSGNVSSGKEITIDGGGGDTTAPTVSITTSDPSSITSDSLSVTGTASDAIWGTGSVCKWRISAAPDADNGTTISGLTYSGTVDWSFTASGFSRGSNTLYVGCRDAVPNWGSKSMTVNYNPSSQGISGVSGLTVR